MNTNYFSELPLPIAIVGLGVTGAAIYELLLIAGISKESLLTFDEHSHNAQFKTGETLIDIGKPKTLIVSPGVPLSSPWILKAKNDGIFITSELSLANRFLTSERVIAITGSVGKSTTTCLLRAALEKFCPSYFVGGNLGIPLARYVIELLQNQREIAEWIVLELSSYQLENYPELKAEFSSVTYLTSNHLERYPDKEAYYETKWILQKYTSKYLILNQNGGELKDWLQSKSQSVPWKWVDRNIGLMNQYHLKDCQLLGSHNLDNIALAAEIVNLAEWPTIAYEGLRSFRGLPHRVENLGTAKGIRFINDSKATTIESVKTALTSTLESIPPNNILHLLIGGKDKNLPWNDLGFLKNNNQIKLYFFGDCKSVAQSKSGLKGPLFSTMLESCSTALSNAKPGDTILLSPGGTSFDEFKNFEHRGEVFKTFVEKLSP